MAFFTRFVTSGRSALFELRSCVCDVARWMDRLIPQLKCVDGIEYDYLLMLRTFISALWSVDIWINRYDGIGLEGWVGG